MSDARVYVETSIPSFYFETRAEPEMQARRSWTREWWDFHRHSYEVVTSDAVLDELAGGDYPARSEAVALVSVLPLVPFETAVAEIVQAYIEHNVMPRDPLGDALHLALASHHKCDFLLTWNCAHLANANKFAHIKRINTLLGLFVPSLVTPLEMIGGTTDET